jgi:predicted nuclease of predicted toxin-antitoxin system
VLTLREAGHIADHWSQIGAVTAPDAEIMSYAQDHGYVIITNDLDFSAILAATNGTGPSVVQVRSTDLRPAALSAPVINALAQLDELRSGALVTIDPARTCVRVLPLNAGR